MLFSFFLTFIFLILPVILSLIYGIRSESRIGKVFSWICASLAPSFICFLFLSLNGFFYRFSGGDNWLLVYGYILILALWALIIFRKISQKKYWISYLALCLCFAIAIGAYNAWDSYQRSIPELSESENMLYNYDPLQENNQLAHLDNPPSLTLSGELPRLDGATALYPVYAAFANAAYPDGALEDAVHADDPWGWMEENDLLRCTTTSEAYQALIDGEVDIIFVAAPSQEQAQKAKALGEEMVFTPIGKEGFVFFVNSENPVQDLSVEQLRGIYSGKITKWDEFSADLGKIRAFQRDEGSGSQTTLVRFMGETPLMTPPTEEIIGGMGGIIEFVADYKNYKNAIGYSFRFYSSEMVKNDQIRLLSINGIAPTIENIANDTYPISGEFYAVKLSSNKNANVDIFIEWMLSEEGQELIKKTGYVPLKIKD